MLPDAVLQKLDALPAQPGVYLFKDKKGAVVYVGKAKSLRARVRSYFQDAQGDARAFIPILQRTIGDLETIVTANEKEATILENNLVKKHHPKFNVKLRDDKDFITLRLGAAARGPAAAPPPPVVEVVVDAGPSAAPPHEHAPVGASPRRGPEQRVSTAAEWPRLEVVRRPKPDGAGYFGPYHSATAARRTLHLVNKHFQLRTCSDAEFAGRRRPCLQHQIKRCPGPCVLPVDGAFYGEQVTAVAKFLEGRHDELSRELNEKMKGAARQMRFELAAVYRDQLRAIEKVREEQRVVTIDDVDRDVVGLYREGELVEIALLHVRAGKLADVATYSIRQAEIPDEEIVAAFLAQHHGAASPWPSPSRGRGRAAHDAGGGPDSEQSDVPVRALVPDEVILPCEPEGIQGIAEWLSDRAGHRVVLIVPKRGHRVDLLAMANDNARHSFAEKQRQSDDVRERLCDLQQRLRLPVIPRRIECCDISHLGGGDTVGAVVAMTDGELDKTRYRSFNVRGDSMPSSAPGHLNDDYGAMYEVLARRFRRAIQAEQQAAAIPAVTRPAYASGAVELPESEPSPATPTAADPSAADADPWDAPDLFVVDGGRGQLAVALAAARDLGLHDLPIVALAKERESLLGGAMTDRVYLPGQKNPIPLKSGTTSLFLLARLRDEAHRFSNRGRMRLGKKRRMHSPLDDVKGLGSRAKKALLRHVGNLAAIRAAEDSALHAVPGISARHVRAIRTAYPREGPEEDARCETQEGEGPAGDACAGGNEGASAPTREGIRQRS